MTVQCAIVFNFCFVQILLGESVLDAAVGSSVKTYHTRERHILVKTFR